MPQTSWPPRLRVRIENARVKSPYVCLARGGDQPDIEGGIWLYKRCFKRRTGGLLFESRLLRRYGETCTGLCRRSWGSCPPEMPRRPDGIAHRFWIVTIIARLVRRGFRPPREPTQTPALLLEAWSEADRLVPERFIPIRRLRCPARGGADVPQPAAAKRTGIRESLNTAFRCMVCPKPEPDCPKPGVQRNGGTSGCAEPDVRHSPSL